MSRTNPWRRRQILDALALLVLLASVFAAVRRIVWSPAHGRNESTVESLADDGVAAEGRKTTTKKTEEAEPAEIVPSEPRTPAE